MPVVTYTALRLGLLAAAAVVLYLLGMRGWLLVLVAALVGWGLSYLLLARQRDAAARSLAARDARRRAARGTDEDTLAEDAEADAADEDR